MCHVSPVTYHRSPVTCHLSPVTCHMSQSFFIPKKIVQSGGASQWRVPYQQGLPRLVYLANQYNHYRTHYHELYLHVFRIFKISSVAGTVLQRGSSLINYLVG